MNLGRLQRAIDEGRIDAAQPIDGAVLQKAGLVGKLLDGVRLLGRGELSAKLASTVAGASQSAVKAVEAAGGSVTVVAPKKPVAEAEA